MATIFKRGDKGPWIVQWFDHTGVRREKSARTTDKRRAEQLASKLEGDAMLRREGIIDPTADEYSAHRTVPLSEHLSAPRGTHPPRLQPVPRADGQVPASVLSHK